MTVVASLRGVSKKYGATLALRPTDLDLRTGVTGLLGPNGAGKSTLLRLLATAQPPTHRHHLRRRPRRDRLGRRADRGPAPARLPAPGGRLPAAQHRLRLPRLPRRPQGVDRHRGPAPRGAAGARPGRARQPRRQAGLGPVRRPAPPAVHRPGPDGRPDARRPRRADHRPRPRAARVAARAALGAGAAPAAYCSPPTRPRTSRRSATASSSSTPAPSASTAPSPSSSPPPPARCGSATRRTTERSAPGGPDRARCARSEELLGPTPSSSSRRWRTRISSCARPPDPMKELSHEPQSTAGDVRRGALRARHARPSRDLAYLKHPLFLVGARAHRRRAGLRGRRDSSSLYHVIAPATCLGVFGIMVMAGLVRRSDQAHAAAGTVVLSERERTYALASAAVVPFTAGLAFFAWAVWEYHAHPPQDYTMPFGGRRRRLGLRDAVRARHPVHARRPDPRAGRRAVAAVPRRRDPRLGRT